MLRGINKYLVLLVVFFVLFIVCGVINGETGALMLLLIVAPVSGLTALIFLIYDIFHSKFFRKNHMKLWWIKYFFLVITVYCIYPAGWFDKPFDNHSFWFSQTIFFGKMVAQWKVYIGTSLIILFLWFIIDDIFQYLFPQNYMIQDDKDPDSRPKLF